MLLLSKHKHHFQTIVHTQWFRAYYVKYIRLQCKQLDIYTDRSPTFITIHHCTTYRPRSERCSIERKHIHTHLVNPIDSLIQAPRVSQSRILKTCNSENRPWISIIQLFPCFPYIGDSYVWSHIVEKIPRTNFMSWRSKHTHQFTSLLFLKKYKQFVNGVHFDLKEDAKISFF